MYDVYVLKDDKSKELYYGYTNNLKRRMLEHNNKKQSWGLIYYEAYTSETDARNREKRFKNYAQALTALKIRLKESLK